MDKLHAIGNGCAGTGSVPGRGGAFYLPRKQAQVQPADARSRKDRNGCASSSD